MVVEITPGTYKCERKGCTETVTADNPNSKRSRARAERAAVLHEQKDAIHVFILNLSSMPEKLGIPRSGFAVMLATTENITPLSERIIDQARVAVEASILIQTLDSSDYKKQRGGRIPKADSVIAAQQHRDGLRLLHLLLAPPVVGVKV